MAHVLEALKALNSLNTAADEDERATGVDDGGSEALSKVKRPPCLPSPHTAQQLALLLAGMLKSLLRTQEIFTEYRPSSITRGLPHPGSIAEATSLR